MWSSVYEIGVSHECGTEAYDWTIEGCYEDLSVGVEGVRDV